MKFFFRNLFVLLTVLTVTAILSGCGGSTNSTEGTTASTTATTTATTGTTASTTGTTTTAATFRNQVDLGGKTVTIMCNVLTECDPNNENYSGTFKDERMARQAAVEAAFNVNVEYISYPDSAGWGPTRYNAIINAVSSGLPMANIYTVTSDWVPQLVNGDAIVPVTTYLRDYADALYDHNNDQFSKFLGKTYGFTSGYVLNDTAGLYYNMDLLQEIGMDSPAALWNAGEWTWTDFQAYVLDAQAKLASYETPHYAVGGPTPLYAQYMTGANGGYLIDPLSWNVAFTDTACLQTFTFLNAIYTSGVWEPSPVYDTGSTDWLSGNVLFYPGELWFTNSPIRWGAGSGVEFGLGYVPFPISDTATLADYRTGVAGRDAFVLSKGFDENPDAVNSRDAFIVWDALQDYGTKEEALAIFTARLRTSFDDEASIEANLSVVDKVYPERIFGIGIGGWATGQWYIEAALAVQNGDANTRMQAMAPLYQAALDAMKEPAA